MNSYLYFHKCFVHPIFSTFGFLYFGHFSWIIFFPFFFFAKCKQGLSNIFASSLSKVTKNQKLDEQNKSAKMTKYSIWILWNASLKGFLPHCEPIRPGHSFIVPTSNYMWFSFLTTRTCHTTYRGNIKWQKCVGISALWVLNEIIQKKSWKYENMVGAVWKLPVK